MSQRQRLLDYLDEHHSITPKQAWSELGIYRLSARIFDLRRQGYDIRTNRKEIYSPFGESTYIAEYRMVR
jgi:hypothetical protein